MGGDRGGVLTNTGKVFDVVCAHETTECSECFPSEGGEVGICCASPDDALVLACTPGVKPGVHILRPAVEVDVAVDGKGAVRETFTFCVSVCGFEKGVRGGWGKPHTYSHTYTHSPNHCRE